MPTGRPIDPRERDKAVARLMLGYWTNFAKTGNSNGEGLPVWPRYDTETDLALEISAEPGTIGGLRKAKLDLFDRRAAVTR